ncbi:MAG: hypothetical protein LUC45_04125 [Paraprevotella sp.]|nr:hypothetical protein [Paraprevotella sp.]
MPKEFASLSLKAIKKILPNLKEYGLIYSEAVFLGNLCEVLPSYIWHTKELRQVAIEGAIQAIHGEKTLGEENTKEAALKNFLKTKYNVTEENLKKLYHQSMLETFPKQRPNED